ncbi:hypothetical protein Tfer_2720 [Thermincola ferriacetica]|uniref:Uncharacterized protein n=1 Tax=Thermincola ferriacetica TaxID=281456 RepID=A0A0L6VZM9_9FIRM|nr:hypothetical protein [Thermincola ferriacetica]KNZ68725.1 hypothetical protein Tfer_2720 [Thermincola ferriacetica]
MANVFDSLTDKSKFSAGANSDLVWLTALVEGAAPEVNLVGVKVLDIAALGKLMFHAQTDKSEFFIINSIL